MVSRFQYIRFVFRIGAYGRKTQQFEKLIQETLLILLNVLFDILHVGEDCCSKYRLNTDWKNPLKKEKEFLFGCCLLFWGLVIKRADFDRQKKYQPYRAGF